MPFAFGSSVEMGVAGKEPIVWIGFFLAGFRRSLATVAGRNPEPQFAGPFGA